VEAEDNRRQTEEETEQEISTLEKEASARKETIRNKKKENLEKATDLVLKHLLE
jgi:hypothetical protein